MLSGPTHCPPFVLNNRQVTASPAGWTRDTTRFPSSNPHASSRFRNYAGRGCLVELCVSRSYWKILEAEFVAWVISTGGTERAEVTFCEKGNFGAVREDTLASRAIVLSLQSQLAKGHLTRSWATPLPSTHHGLHPQP